MCCDQVTPGTNDHLHYILVTPLTVTAATQQEACLSVHRKNSDDRFEVEASVSLHKTNGSSEYDRHNAVIAPDQDETCFKLQVGLTHNNRSRVNCILIETYFRLLACERVKAYLRLYIITEKGLCRSKFSTYSL